MREACGSAFAATVPKLRPEQPSAVDGHKSVIEASQLPVELLQLASILDVPGGHRFVENCHGVDQRDRSDVVC
jgi:hypothetical protein